MKNYTIFVTESIIHKVSMRAENRENALELLKRYTYNNDDAPKESEFYTKSDIGCETDFVNAVFEEAM